MTITLGWWMVPFLLQLTLWLFILWDEWDNAIRGKDWIFNWLFTLVLGWLFMAAARWL